MTVTRMQRTDDSPGHLQRTRAKVTVSRRPLLFVRTTFPVEIDM